MQELADKIVDKGNKVVNKLDVFNPILEGIALGEATMTDVESMVSTIYTAVDVATMIPSVGSSFTPVKNLMNPINTGIGGIKDKLSTFQDSVGSLWSSSIGHLKSIIDSFDTGDMSVVLGISDTFASLQNSTCIPSLLDSLTGVDIFDSVETALVTFVDYVETFVKALEKLLKALRTDEYETMKNVLETVVKFLEDTDTVFTPFNGLGNLLTRTVEIPWISSPYTMIDEGRSRCDSGFSRDVIFQSLCWEANSEKWKRVPLSLPPKMKIKCNAGNYTNHWAGNCNNIKDNRQTRPLRITRNGFLDWDVRCPNNYEIMGFHPFKCYKKCDSDQVAVLGKCWEKRCNPNDIFSISASKAICRRTKVRNREVRTAGCSHRTKPADITWVISFDGRCKVSCKSDEVEILGICWPPGTLEVSIEDIVTEFGKVLGSLSNLPIVSTVLNGIDEIVSGVLQPVMDVIDSVLANAINVPEVDDELFSLDLLPLTDFDSINVSLPDVPDLEPLFEMDLYEKFVSNILPAELSDIVDCGTNITCVLPSLGWPSIDDLMDKIESLYNLTDGVDELVEDLLRGVSCAKWGVHTINMSQVMEPLGLAVPPDACDIHIDVCEHFNFADAEEAMDALNDFVEDKIADIEALFDDNRRRLSLMNALGYLYDFELADRFTTLVSVPVQVFDGFHSDRFDVSGYKLGGKINLFGFEGEKTKEKEAQPMGGLLRFGANLILKLGMKETHHNYERRLYPAIQTSIDGKFSFTRVWSGWRKMWERTLELSRQLDPFNPENKTDIDWQQAWTYFDDKCQLEDGDKFELKTNLTGARSGACQYLKKIVDIINGTGSTDERYSSCSKSTMETDYAGYETLPDNQIGLDDLEVQTNPFDAEITRDIVKCTQFWFKIDKEVTKYLEAYKSKKSL